MFRYADPDACPVCRSSMPTFGTQCAQCETRLTGNVAERLFRTLTYADTLVAELVSLSVPSTVARTSSSAHAAASVPTPAQAPAQPTSPPGLESFPAHPAPPLAPRRTGLSSASVPKILLGLGATCLLVAAIVFLAVAWAALGVGGRTVVLVLLTAASAGASWLLSRARLRAGAEAFMAVALGLLTLDVFGARSAGWLGDLDGGSFAMVLGGVLLVAGIAGALLGRGTPVGSLASSQLVGGLGGFMIPMGLPIGSPTEVALSASAGCVILAAGARATQLLRLPIAAVVLLAGSALDWLGILAVGLTRIDSSPTLAEVWVDMRPWPLLVSAAIMAGAGGLRFLPTLARITVVTVAVALLAFVVVLPAFDESATVLALVELVVIAAACLGVPLLARPWRSVLAVPPVVAAVALFASTAALAATSLDTLLADDPWRLEAGARLDGPDLAWHWPLLLPAGTLGVLLTAWFVASLVTSVPLRRVGVPIVLVATASATLLPPLYDAPLALAVGVLLAATAVLAVLARTAQLLRGEAGVLALVLAAACAVAALIASAQSEVLTAVTTGALAISAIAAAASRNPLARLAGDLAFTPAAGVFLWTLLGLVEIDQSWRSLPILVVVGGWAILGPRVEREVPAAVVAVACVLAAVTGTGTIDQTWLAVDLTLAGVLTHVSALLHTHRRWLGWVGLALLTLAQWVRMEQVGVETPEAYTLPLALVLLAVGAVRMRNSDSLGSTRALGSGLVLALTPSLLLTLGDPVSLRALLLGIGCLTAIVVGLALRWSAPLVAGAVVGLLVVLREVTQSDSLPQWAVIGTIGIVLTLVGVTWESRLADARRASAYLRTLR